VATAEGGRPVTGALWLAALFFNAGIAALPVVTWGERGVLVVGPLAGPFAGLAGPVIGLEADPLGDCLASGLPLAGMILAHPLCPRRWAGVVSAAGLFVWVLLGLSFIHQASG